MATKIFEYSISTTQNQEFVNISNLLIQAIKESGIRDGLAVVFCPHTTAGITINENADPDVVTDIISALERVFPTKGAYRHFEGNSHAHVKASCMGASCSIIVTNGQPVLGRWQSVYFCEFDGPRNRRVYIKVLE